MPDRALFLDIASLTASQWTGISEVNRQLVLYLLDHHAERSFFFVAGQVIDPRYVAAAVRDAPGGYLNHFIQSGPAVAGSLSDAIRAHPDTAGLFANVKPFHRVFDVELMIAYDLSPILMPELHTKEAAAHHARGLVADTRSSDLVCCISGATRDDVVLYLGVAPEKTFVAHLGASDRLAEPPVPAEDAYAVVIGTIEPRKNLALVAELLRCQPEVCDDLALMFVGRRGWGPATAATFDGVLGDPKLSDRIAFTGYLPEASKRRLLRGARFSIYPSLFEGFGLPVLESMAVGCPIIASRTSSIVELGVPDEFLFDPLSVIDFARVFTRVQRLDTEERQALSARLLRQAQAFSWARFCERTVGAALAWPAPYVDARAPAQDTSVASIVERSTGDDHVGNQPLANDRGVVSRAGWHRGAARAGRRGQRRDA